jgi:hypothetical protein
MIVDKSRKLIETERSECEAQAYAIRLLNANYRDRIVAVYGKDQDY